MKKTVFITTLIFLTISLQACSSNEGKTEVVTDNPTVTSTAQNNSSESSSTTQLSEEKESNGSLEGGNESGVDETSNQIPEPSIDTSVFVYAEKVDVTDAREITDHLDLVVYMSEKLTPGLATQHVLTQAYDFLQQKDLVGTKTVTIGVMNGDFRVSQFTVDLQKFKPENEIITSVLNASTIDKMDDAVKEYGNAMELW